MADKRYENLPHIDIQNVVQRNLGDFIRYVDFSDTGLAIEYADSLHEATLTSFSTVAQAIGHINEEDGFDIVAHNLNHASKPHFHDYVEITHVLSGDVMFWVEGKTECVGEGGTMVIRPGVRHVISPVLQDDEECPMETDILAAPPLLERCRTAAFDEEEPVRRWLDEAECQRKYILVLPGDSPQLESAISRLITQYGSSPQRLLDYGVMGVFLECLHYLGQFLSTQAVVLSPLIAEIQQYIEDDFVHINIDQIAQQTGYSSGYLMRLVKAKTGKTLGTLINESRLRQASALLLTTNDTVAQVGKAVGFQSPSYFHKRFQECYGLTPKQYRDAFPKYLPEEQPN